MGIAAVHLWVYEKIEFDIGNSKKLPTPNYSGIFDTCLHPATINSTSNTHLQAIPCVNLN
jgi:hypothetical protein